MLTNILILTRKNLLVKKRILSARSMTTLTTINFNSPARKIALETFYRFCMHFKDIPLKDLPKDKEFIK